VDDHGSALEGRLVARRGRLCWRRSCLLLLLRLLLLLLLLLLPVAVAVVVGVW